MNRRRARRSDLLPLMDVIFLVLAVFFYLILYMTPHHGIELNLPAAKSSEADVDPFVTVSLRADAAIYVDGVLTPMAGLTDAIADARNGEEKQVYISADRSVEYHYVAEVLDTLRLARISNLALEMDSSGQ